MRTRIQPEASAATACRSTPSDKSGFDATVLAHRPAGRLAPELDELVRAGTLQDEGLWRDIRVYRGLPVVNGAFKGGPAAAQSRRLGERCPAACRTVTADVPELQECRYAGAFLP